MHPATTIRPKEPLVAEQWNLFGGCDEIIDQPPPPPPPPPPPKPKTTAAPRPKKAPPAQTATVSPLRKSTPVPATVKPAAVDDFPLPGQRYDDGTVPDIETLAPEDGIETMLAKRMFLRMILDIDPDGRGKAAVDLFGQDVSADQGDQDRLDALVWMYSLNPDPVLVSFEWVCDVLGFDPHRVRRITGRSMRADLMQIVDLLSTIVSQQHAQLCEERLSYYLDVSDWKPK